MNAVAAWSERLDVVEVGSARFPVLVLAAMWIDRCALVRALLAQLLLIRKVPSIRLHVLILIAHLVAVALFRLGPVALVPTLVVVAAHLSLLNSVHSVVAVAHAICAIHVLVAIAHLTKAIYVVRHVILIAEIGRAHV